MTPAFLGELHVKPTAVAGDWQLLADFPYRTMVTGRAHVITVPRGFVTDFASIPRPLRAIYESWGTYGHAAVVHDWLYVDQPLSRADSDKVFLEAMLVSGCPRIRSRIMYYAVRIGGAHGWRKRAAGRLRGVRQ